MSLTGIITRINVLQSSRKFKIAASILVLALLIFGYGSLWVAAKKAQQAGTLGQTTEQVDQAMAATPGLLQGARNLLDTTMISMVDPLTVIDLAVFRISVTAPLLAVLVFAAAALVVIWLDLALTYLLFWVVGSLVAWPMTYWRPTAAIGQLIIAVIPLAMLFSLMMQVLRLAFSGPLPMLAIARNVLNEAVRMKISVVFIVLLMLFLALTPTLLNEDQPLRYRVQQWLQFGTGLSYLVVAFLTIFLSVATVAFEQRDKIIWQTVTKPVPRWQYLLGKWLGVMGLNAVLLIITASGVYMFTEYLRYQPANGEFRYNVPKVGEGPTLDRRLLETQVLVARVGVKPDLPELSAEQIRDAIDQEILEMQTRDSEIEDTPALRNQIRRQIIDELVLQSRSVDPGDFRKFTFSGMKNIRDRYIRYYGEFGEKPAEEGAAKPPSDVVTDLTFRYKVNAGANDPSAIYDVLFLLNQEIPIERQVALKASQNFTLSPNVLNPDGSLEVEVGNHPGNPRTITFPPDGLELLYVAGGYEMNFIRIMLVMWLKLGFIAAVAIAASTFLSFPIACLVTLVVFFSAESSAFLAESLDEYFNAGQGHNEYWKVVISFIGRPVTWAFGVYSDLKPATNLVDGRLVGWGLVIKAIAVLGAWTVGVLAAGLGIFRQRELALYSGQ